MKKLLVLVFAIAGFQLSRAQDLEEVNRATSNAHEHFGWSMAMDGEWLVIGSPHTETTEGSDAGKVEVYRKNGSTWEAFQTIEDVNGGVFQNFGFSVDVSGTVMVVGAIGTFELGPFTGRANVYEFDGTEWALSNKLNASDAGPGHHFGHSVATNGTLIVVGAIKANGIADQTGAAYTFEKQGDNWAFQTKLSADDGAANDNFGFDVDVNANGQIVVGAPNQSDFIDKSGAAYIYDPAESGHAQTTKLKAFARTEKDFFGTAVAINGNEVVAGAFLADGVSNNTGSVYYFREEDAAWREIQQIAYPGGALNDYFGKTLDLADFRLVVGAPKVNVAGNADVGQSYYYEKDGGFWQLQQVLNDPEATAHNYFGASVVVTDFELAISARMDDVNGQDGGAVYAAGLGEVLSNEEVVLEEAIALVNFPNPTQQQVTIRYRLLKPSRVAIEVFDNSGMPVKSLLPETLQSTGDQEIEWNLAAYDGSGVANGLYFYKLSIDGNVFTRKIIVAR